MSIIYINPGFSSLMEDFDFKSYQNNEEKYTRSKQYFIPLEYEKWGKIYSNYKMTDWYFKFDLYSDLTNDVWNGKIGFIKLNTLSYNLQLCVDSNRNLRLIIGDVSLYSTPFVMQKLTSYELHVKSTKTEEVIELFINNEKVYTNFGKSYIYFNGENPTSISCKNIVYLPDIDMYRHGIAFSNFIIGNTKLGDITCDIVDTTIDSDWDKSNDVYSTTTENKYIKQNVNIKLEDEAILAVAIGTNYSYSDSSLKTLDYYVGDTYVNSSGLSPEEKGVESEVMEVNPTSGIFWDETNITQSLYMKSGVKK